MTTNTLAAIRERKRAYMEAINEFAATSNRGGDTTEIEWRIEDLIDQRLDDISALLAIVDALTARAEAAEAALQEIADFSVLDEHGTIEYDALDESFDRLQGIAITALGDAHTDPADALAAHASGNADDGESGGA